MPEPIFDSQPSRYWANGLHIGVVHYEAMVHHAQAEAPVEACGIMGGRDGWVSLLIPVPNIAQVPTVRYAIHPTAFLAAYSRIAAMGAELIAIYHSHPHGDPVPSATDVAEATWPDAAYVIVGLRDSDSPQMAAWQLSGGHAAPIGLYVDDQQIDRSATVPVNHKT